jgi:hypothetical protein
MLFVSQYPAQWAAAIGTAIFIINNVSVTIVGVLPVLGVEAIDHGVK